MSDSSQQLRKFSKKESKAYALEDYYSKRVGENHSFLFLLSIAVGTIFVYLFSMLLLKTFKASDIQPSDQKVITSVVTTATPISHDRPIRENTFFSSNKQLINDIKLLSDLARYGDEGEYQKHLDKLFTQYPDNITVLKLLARNFKKIGDDTQYYKTIKFIAEKTGSLSDLKTLAQYLVSRNQYEDVVKLLSVIVEKDQKNVPIAEILAYSYLELEAWEQARKLYAMLVDKSPYEPSYWIGFAKSQENSHLRQEALNSYHQALNLQPDLPIKKLALAGVIRLKSYEYSQLQSS